MKRFTALMLALLMLMLLCASCTPNDAVETEPATEAETETETETETTVETEPETTSAPETEGEPETEAPIPVAGMDSGIVRDGTPKKYFTLRLDDCTTQDGDIIEIFKKYNFDAVTFYMNTGRFGISGDAGPGVKHVRYTKRQALKVYQGYDVGVHTVNHPSLLNHLFNRESKVAQEVNDDAKNIQNMYGYTPAGMAWPGGDTEWDANTVNIVRERTTMGYGMCTTRHGTFALPTSFLTWYPTCGFSDWDALTLLQQFIDAEPTEDMLFCVWGHGYELDIVPSRWDTFEQMIQMITAAAAEDDSIVLVTNSEFYQLFKDEIPR